MCGIAGVLLKNKKQKEKGDILIKSMLEKIIHRGPDDEGSYVDDSLAFGMRRLSIIDLKCGHQPISSKDGNLTIVFNGEIYNFKTLRNDLISSGVIFKTQSDTEVILKLYERKGEGMVKDLRGMFVFAIYDKQKKEIFIARDQFGIKPLYYEKENGKIRSFASEIKSLFEVSKDKKYKINKRALYNYLSYQYNPFEESLFSGIYKLLPGHFMKIKTDTGKFKIIKYFEFVFTQDEKLDEINASKKLKKILEDSVKHHMVSDVTVGSFLSGGIDSAVIATLARKHKPDSSLQTFTVGGMEKNEFTQAKEMSDLLETNHTEVLLCPNKYFTGLLDVVKHFDEPVADPSAVALYFLAQEASKKVKVVMSGEGSDELFGGYNIYREPLAINILQNIPSFILKPILFIVDFLPFSFWGLNYLKRAGKKLEDRYIGNANIFKNRELEKIWLHDKQEKFDLSIFYNKVTNLSDSTKMQFIDINTWLIGDILAKADKMTMAHSLELRVPFLDKKVAEFASIIPDSLKFKNGETKYLFRKSVKGLVPKLTQKRKKLGFPIPLAEWFRTVDGWDDTILKNELVKKYFDCKYIVRLIKKHKLEKENNARKIFTLLMLATWYNQFKDKLII